MCVILVGKIGKANHKQAKQQNPDGFSFYTKEQGLIKSPSDEQVEQAVSQWGIWHYRIKSSGPINLDMIHPFKVMGGKAVLYHNGVIGAGTATKSDTALLAESLMDKPKSVVLSVLDSLANGSAGRFLLASATDPLKFRTFGKWEWEKGVLMSHKLYSYAAYSKQTTAQKAGWVTDHGKYKTYGTGKGSTRDETCYPAGYLTDYKKDEFYWTDDEINWKKVLGGKKSGR